MRIGRGALIGVVAALFGSGCGDAASATGGGDLDAGAEVRVQGDGAMAEGGADAGGGAAEVRLPEPGAAFDYQLGGAYGPPAGVVAVVRDRTAHIAPGLYNVCYVNGFQAQPGDRRLWLDEHPDLVLRDGDGEPVIDPDWDELLLDVGTPGKRAAIAEIVGPWIDGCAQAGYDAVEIDNLDTYTRADRLLGEADAVAMIALFAARAHAAGLAIAQKNTVEIAHRRAELGTDFAVAEECARYDECDAYDDAYDGRVFVIEYRRKDFDRGCAAYPALSVILRDRDLVTPGDDGYVYDVCAR